MTSQFDQMAAAMRELAEAQKQTESRLGELAQAQVRTESRLGDLASRLGELAQALVRTDSRLGDLASRLGELAQAQVRTESRLGDLARAQAQTESTVAELVQAQARIFKTLDKYAREQRETWRQLGGLSTAVGFGLEDAALKALPALLQKDLGVMVHGRLTRTWVNDNEGNSVEVNIFGRASKEGREVVIVGESKSQLSLNDVYKFKKQRLDAFEGVFDEVIPVLVTHMTSSAGVEPYVKERGIPLYYSYDF